MIRWVKKYKIIILVGLLSVFIVILIFKRVHKTTYTQKLKNTIYQNDFDIVYGDESAALSIYVYSRYSCVFCRKFFKETFPKINEEYIISGKVKLIVKLVDFSNNSNIRNSQKTVICINQHGDIEKLNELLLLEPSVIYSAEFNEVVDEFIEKDIFVAECMLDGVVDNYLINNVKEFKNNQLTGTPSIVINNKVYKGFKDFAFLKKIIEKELSKSLK